MPSSAIREDPAAVDVDDVSPGTKKQGAAAIHQSRASILWDRGGKGYLTESERVAKEHDKDGKGYLNPDEAAKLGSQVNTLMAENKKITRMVICLIILSVVLFVGGLVAISMLIKRSKELTVDEDGRLSNASNGAEVHCNSQGLKLISYPAVVSDGDEDDEEEKTCVTAFDLAHAWHQNENGGTATLVISSDEKEEVVRLENSDSKMRKKVVSFGNVKFRLDPDCGGAGRNAEDAHRNLREHVRAFRDDPDYHHFGTAARRLADNDGYKLIADKKAEENSGNEDNNGYYAEENSSSEDNNGYYAEENSDSNEDNNGYYQTRRLQRRRRRQRRSAKILAHP